MKISTRGQYGLEALIALALNASDQPVSIKTIAQYCDLSEAYILQIFLLLRRAGIVSSIRGAQGGYMLSCKPAEINVKQILEVLEGPLTPVACIVEGCEAPCTRYEMCATRLLWEKVRQKMDAITSTITLDDLVKHFHALDAIQNPDYCI